jgi:hypothetical protein
MEGMEEQQLCFWGWKLFLASTKEVFSVNIIFIPLKLLGIKFWYY